MIASFVPLSVLLSFLVPAVWARELCALLSFYLIIRTVEGSRRPARTLFAQFFLIHLVAFYWLPDTLKVFGGFPLPVTFGLHILFALTAALQFWLVGIFYRKLWKESAPIGAFAVTWGAVDYLFPQLFPWTMANPLVECGPIAALAELCGVTFLSVFLFFAAEGIEKIRREGLRSAKGEGAFILVALVFGLFLDLRAKDAEHRAPHRSIGLVQGNISLDEKFTPSELRDNLEVYQRLSRQAEDQGAEFLVWPETVMTEWTPTVIRNLRTSPYDPGQFSTPLLYGALTFERRQQVERGYVSYNGVLLQGKGGEVLGHYAKRVLMPFGEYLPFESLFPALRDFSPASGDFTSGESSEPLVVSELSLRVIPLICYEDLVPWLSAAGVANKGNILINMTNDAWYGNTAAPFQHQLLAQWRAIEFRRTLLRATNTGLTSVTFPSGRQVSALPVFQHGVIVKSVPLLDVTTLYARLGDLPFLLFCLVYGIVGWRMKRLPR